jgi:hypothetical protein
MACMLLASCACPQSMHTASTRVMPESTISSLNAAQAAVVAACSGGSLRRGQKAWQIRGYPIPYPPLSSNSTRRTTSPLIQLRRLTVTCERPT